MTTGVDGIAEGIECPSVAARGRLRRALADALEHDGFDVVWSPRNPRGGVP